jgi:hypothetical protein
MRVERIKIVSDKDDKKGSEENHTAKSFTIHIATPEPLPLNSSQMSRARTGTFKVRTKYSDVIIRDYDILINDQFLRRCGLCLCSQVKVLLCWVQSIEADPISSPILGPKESDFYLMMETRRAQSPSFLTQLLKELEKSH